MTRTSNVILLNVSFYYVIDINIHGPHDHSKHHLNELANSHFPKRWRNSFLRRIFDSSKQFNILNTKLKFILTLKMIIFMDNVWQSIRFLFVGILMGHEIRLSFHMKQKQKGICPT